ncbi:MAG: ribonuclease III [Clostridia bacterium]|nr:ribonuclease III [Clostridia bacterium]
MEQNLPVNLEGAFSFGDIRSFNALQLAYLGDTLHDLYVRSYLLTSGMQVGAMHKMATHMVSAAAQTAMLSAIEPELEEAELDMVRKGRNAQAKHAPPKHASAADYGLATGLEALWGMLYVEHRQDRMLYLMGKALKRTEELWQKHR